MWRCDADTNATLITRLTEGGREGETRGGGEDGAREW